MIIETRIAGMPAQVEISRFEGEWDLENVMDRKGYDAPWLGAKLEDPAVMHELIEDVQLQLREMDHGI